MRKITLWIIGILFLLVVFAGVGLLKNKNQNSDIDFNSPSSLDNTTYLIDGKRVDVKHFFDDKKISIGVRHFGDGVIGDFDNDGAQDVVSTLVQTTSGTGNFYYVALARGSEDGPKGMNAIFLGDRIAPQTIEYRDGMIIVNYAERKAGEPFTTPPSVGVSRYFRVENGGLKEVIPPKIGTPAPKTSAEKCASNGGTWFEQYKECTGVDENMCNQIGGSWNGCASPCRHDPKAEVCTAMCVLVCEF